MRTVVITGSASGIGQVTAEKLTALGDRVIGVDLHNAAINADLTADAGRTHMVVRVRELATARLTQSLPMPAWPYPFPQLLA